MYKPSELGYLVIFKRKNAGNVILAAYRSAAGNAVHAARALGISHSTLLRYVRQLGLRDDVAGVRQAVRGR